MLTTFGKMFGPTNLTINPKWSHFPSDPPIGSSKSLQVKSDPTYLSIHTVSCRFLTRSRRGYLRQRKLKSGLFGWIRKATSPIRASTPMFIKATITAWVTLRQDFTLRVTGTNRQLKHTVTQCVQTCLLMKEKSATTVGADSGTRIKLKKMFRSTCLYKIHTLTRLALRLTSLSLSI